MFATRRLWASLPLLISILFLDQIVYFVKSFSQGYNGMSFFGGFRNSLHAPARIFPHFAHLDADDLEASIAISKDIDRRKFVQYGFAAVLLGGDKGSVAFADQGGTVNECPPSSALPHDANLDCLLDLPPVSDNFVRIYLCRHGQTEFNRLRVVQGAQVDPPINKNGVAMAERLGMAFARLPARGDKAQKIMHSKALRATQTAQIASKQLPASITLDTMGSLGEVNFGSFLEGKKVADVRTDIVRIYGAWASGFIDARPSGGGESGREVLKRAMTTLSTLTQAATRNGGSIIAISHSTYLRMLLATAMDIPLAKAATLTQANGCINVLDVAATKDLEQRTLSPKSALFGGPVSQAPSDFHLRVPRCNVVRINENRHLEGIL